MWTLKMFFKSCVSLSSTMWLSLVLCSLVQNSEQIKEGAVIPCSRSDPNLNDCLLKASPVLFKALTKAHPKYNWKIKDPMQVGPIESKAGSGAVGLNFKMVDNQLIGLSKAKFTDLKVDLKRLELRATLLCPKCEVFANYQMDGRIIILPINGKGKAHVTLNNVHLDLHIIAEVVNKNGTDRLRAKTYTYKIRPRKTRFQFENLFNGDKFMGSQMNQFMNDNDLEVAKMFIPAVERGLEAQDLQEFDNLMAAVPYDNLLLD